MLSKVRKVSAVVVTSLLLALLAGLAGALWLVRHDGWLVQTVATGSMAPAMPSGSLIISRPVDPADVRVGDVIVFRSPTGATVSGGADGAFEATEAMLITHRVVRVDDRDGEPAFRTKGDGNDEVDPWVVTGPMLRARYVAHVPVVGGILTTPGVRRWLFLGVAALGALVIVTETRSIVRELRSRHDATRDPDPVPDEVVTSPAPAD